MEFVIMIIFFIVVFIAWSYREKEEKKRIEGVKAVATRMKFSPLRQKDTEFVGRLQHFPLFSQNDSRKITNVIQGTVNDIDVTIMDYEYRIRSSDRFPNSKQTIILCGSHKLQLPSFTLRPKVVIAGFGFIRADIRFSREIYHELDFSSYPSFSDHYALQGSNEDEIRGLFNKNILSYYEMHSGLVTKGNGEQLLFYDPSETILSENIPSFMEQGLQVFELFRAAHQEWTEVLRRLEERKQHPGSPAPLIADLAHGDWRKQFMARHTLAALGGEAVEPLMAALEQDSDDSFRETAVWVLKRVIEDTTTHLARNAPHLVCSRCLVHFRAHRVNLSWWQGAFTYYGCRVCRQSREFFDWPGEIVAALDQEMSAEQAPAGKVLRINWLKRGALFDFDRVEIVKSNDEQVERFAVQVGNDTDDFRSPHYKKMVCEIAPDCVLSENTLRILKRTFGEVQHQA